MDAHKQKTEIVFSDARKICISNADEISIVRIGDIIHCESRRNYTIIHMADKSCLMASKTLGDFEKLLGAYGFFRVHHSHLINLFFVKSYKKNNGGYVVMTDDVRIAVAVRRREDFISRLKTMSCASL